MRFAFVVSMAIVLVALGVLAWTYGQFVVALGFWVFGLVLLAGEAP